MHVLETNVHGNPNIGLYGFATNHYCLLGREVPEKEAKLIGKVLKVPVHQLSICGTSLLGIFCVGNDKTVLVPELIYDKELKILDKHNIPYAVLPTDLTALGNNILSTNKGCLVSKNYTKKQFELIKDALEVPTKPGTIAGLDTVGALAVLNKNGCVVHRDITAKEKNILEKIFKVKAETATVNMGNPYLKAGIICNDNGFIVGDTSGGPEITYIDEMLGFL